MRYNLGVFEASMQKEGSLDDAYEGPSPRGRSYGEESRHEAVKDKDIMCVCDHMHTIHDT